MKKIFTFMLMILSCSVLASKATHETITDELVAEGILTKEESLKIKDNLEKAELEESTPEKVVKSQGPI